MSGIKMNVIELMGMLRGDEDAWGIGVARMAWGDNPTSVDIRHMNLLNNRPGKGVSLTDEEVERLFLILLQQGYGDIEDIQEELDKRGSLFEYGELVNENELDDGLTITVYDSEGELLE